ncbi:MAG: hypothetical protein FJZ00_11950 [Candidatus Sericytochromatia bacterium]|uniref:DUF6644 domain-containing protein n=1 Tax=Candidatus Tanganyikabacteria bacterium TaxID=2961651 RepID=A0A937X7R6_9BACT|nr:hypothetical protein [Candidatus Tanganyikabacteria bacterium]MBM3778677.1 hypothetical protein [Acidimicrobiia bacterium]
MLRPFFDWFQQLAFSVAFRQSTWMFAVIDALHLVAIAVFAGAILLVDFRLLGAGLKDRPVAQVARDAQPWLVGSLIVLLLTGLPMIMGNGDKYYYSDIFWQKMVVLLVAFVYTFTVRRAVAAADEGRLRPFWRRATGATSLGLWLIVAVWGRLIGLL